MTSTTASDETIVRYAARLELPDRCLRKTREILLAVPLEELPPTIPHHAVLAAAVMMGAAFGREPITIQAVSGQLGIPIDLIERAEAELADRLDLEAPF